MSTAQCCLALVDSDEQRIVDSAFDTSAIAFVSAASRSLEVLSRGIATAGRDAASRAFAYASKLPGGIGNRPSATTSGREELTDGEAFLLHPAPDRSPKSRGGAPRGERPASWDVRRLAKRLRATITGPPTGAAAPERLSALRFLLAEEANDGERRKPRKAHASRER